MVYNRLIHLTQTHLPRTGPRLKKLTYNGRHDTTGGNMSFATWARRAVMFGLIAMSLLACSEPPPVVSDETQTTLTLVEGQATWFHRRSQSQSQLSGSAGLNWDDRISTSSESGAVLELPDNTLIKMGPDTQITVRRPFPPDDRTVIRLLSGKVQINTQSTRFRFDSYREVPKAFQIVIVNMIIEPIETPGVFDLQFDENTSLTEVFSGSIGVRASGTEGLLMPLWRAELVPGEELRIISPYTPTPRDTRTLTPTLTPSVTQTPSVTSTPSVTPTPTSTQTYTPRPTVPSATPTDTAVPPTNTPRPRPTKTPVPPTLIPSNTPLPTFTPSDTPRPTPGG